MLKKIAITILFVFLSSFLKAQSQGPLSPATSGTNNSIGTIDWSNTSNVFVSDGNRALSNNLTSGDVSYYLTATNFSFSIPAGASIDGIIVEIQRSDASGSGNIKDNIVKLIKGGAIVGVDKSSGGNWPSSDSYTSYGSSTNTWGSIFTSADINANDFGVAISINKIGAPGINDGRINHIRITVYYTITLPIELSYFGAVKNDNANLVKWHVDTQTNNEKFILEKSSDAIEWEIINQQYGAGNTSEKKFYSHYDSNPFFLTYYRLTQVDFDGKKERFKLISVENDYARENQFFKIFPNPTNTFIVIQVVLKEKKKYSILIVNEYGKLIFAKDLIGEKGINDYYFYTYEIDYGSYIVQVKTETQFYSTIFLKR